MPRRRAAGSGRSNPVRVARIYEPPTPDDGARVLVDRLWPRGLKKADAELHAWCKDIAPSTELRTWYAHDPARFSDFAARYRTELEAPPRSDALTALRRLHTQRPVTLLTATKAPDLSHAQVLADVLTAPAPTPASRHS